MSEVNPISLLYVTVLQGRRKVFITDQAKFNPEHYSINAWADDNFSTAIIFYYNVISLTGLIIILPLYVLLGFLYNKHLVSIMRGRPIILHLLICFFYLL